MAHMRIIMKGDGAFQELQGKHVRMAAIEAATVLAGGMQSGKASVAFLIPLNDGSFVIAETSLALLVAAVRAFDARYGEASALQGGTDHER